MKLLEIRRRFLNIAGVAFLWLIALVAPVILLAPNASPKDKLTAAVLAIVFAIVGAVDIWRAPATSRRLHVILFGVVPAIIVACAVLMVAYEF